MGHKYHEFAAARSRLGHRTTTIARYTWPGMDPADSCALLRLIIANASILEVDGAPTHLLVVAPCGLLDALSGFESEAQDLEESDLEDSDDFLAEHLLAGAERWKPPPYS